MLNVWCYHQHLYITFLHFVFGLSLNWFYILQVAAIAVAQLIALWAPLLKFEFKYSLWWEGMTSLGWHTLTIFWITGVILEKWLKVFKSIGWLPSQESFEKLSKNDTCFQLCSIYFVCSIYTLFIVISLQPLLDKYHMQKEVSNQECISKK